MNRSTPWENVYIFISSTFNDMHAERDYLIKRVFPAVRAFCGGYKLNLLDVDLRWGITEEDASKNKRVVEICLSNLDRCRPFFIGLLGQRRGWVPGPRDISPETLSLFPGLSRYLGRNSITELELIHGILEPLAEGEKRMRHAFLFRRDPSYLEDITDPAVLDIYDDRQAQPAAEPPKKERGFFSRLTRGISRKKPETEPEQERETLLLDQIIARAQGSPDAGQVTVAPYHVTWDPSDRTPELSNVGGKDLSAGRLTDFRVGEETLSDYLIRTLEQAIREEFPDHFQEQEAETPLQQELDRQETALFHASDLYIPRPAEEQKILDYFQGNASVPYLLSAAAGTGKTSLLAHLIRRMQEELQGEMPSAQQEGSPAESGSYHLFYRLCGTSTESSSSSSAIESLCREMAAAGLVDEEEIQMHRHEILLYFRSILEHTKQEPVRILLDAVDQWSEFDRDLLEWIPETLPSHVKLLISLKTEGSEAQRKSLSERGIPAQPLAAFSGEKEKRQLIRNYLAAFLKDVTEDQIRQLISMKGSDNPLYLKIILNELRLHGSFDTLFAQLGKNYGTTPADAFGQLMSRLMDEQFTDAGSSRTLTVYFLGLLACATEPLPFREMPPVLKESRRLSDGMTEEQMLDGLYIIARHLADFLMLDGGSTAYRYDSFRQAYLRRVKKEVLQLLNQFLFKLYLNRIRLEGRLRYQEADKNLLQSLGYHGTRAGERFYSWLLTDPRYLHRLVTEAGALAAAGWYREASERGGTEWEYGRVAELLSRRAARYDVGANPLFYELWKAAPDLKLTRMLASRAGKAMELPFYYAAAESAGEGLVSEKEITLAQLAQSEEYSLFFHGDRILQYRSYSDEITILSRETGAVLKKQVLRGKIQHCHQEGDFLHVLYTPGGKDRGAMETLHLPDFSTAFLQEEHPAAPEGFKWSNFIFGAGGRFYEHAWKDGINAESRLYLMNTGEPVISASYEPRSELCTNAYLRTEFCGNCMIEVYCPNNDNVPLRAPEYFLPRQIRFWHIPTRQLFYEAEGEWFGEFTTDGSRLWVLQQGPGEEMHCLVWEEGPEGMRMILDKVLTLPGWNIAVSGAYDGNLCLFFISGEVLCFGPDLELRCEIRGNDLVPTEGWYQSDYHMPLRLYHGQVTYVHKNRVCFFDRSAFEQQREQAEDPLFPPGKAYRSWQVMSRNGFLYMLSDVLKKIDLRKLTAGTETDTQTNAFHYNTEQVWRLGGMDVVFGSIVLTGNYYIQAVSLSLMKPVLRYGMKMPENSSWVAAVYAPGGNQAGVLLEIDTGDDPRTKYSTAEYELQICDYSDGIRLASSGRLPGRSVGLDTPFIFLLDGRILIARSEILEDADHRHVSIWDPETGEETVLMRYETKGHYHLLGSLPEDPRMLVRGSELFLPMTVYEDDQAEGRNIMFVWDLAAGTRRSYDLPAGHCRGLEEERIYLYKRETGRISACRLQDGTVLAELQTRHRQWCNLAIQKGEDYLVFLGNDILEVFDAAGEFRYSQYLASEDVTDCPGTPYFYAGDLKIRHALYRKMEARREQKQPQDQTQEQTG